MRTNVKISASRRGRRRRAGFTLVEMLIVLALIVLIGGLAIGGLGGFFEDARVDTAQQWVKGTGKDYVELYNIKNDDYPASLQDLLQAKDGKRPIVQNASELNDPWDKPYQYKFPGEKNPGSFDLWTVTPQNVIVGNWD